MEKIAGILKNERAQLWINHDKAQRDSLKMVPATTPEPINRLTR
jgi:hypothetical protein